MALDSAPRQGLNLADFVEVQQSKRPVDTAGLVVNPRYAQATYCLCNTEMTSKRAIISNIQLLSLTGEVVQILVNGLPYVVHAPYR